MVASLSAKLYFSPNDFAICTSYRGPLGKADEFLAQEEELRKIEIPRWLSEVGTFR